MDQDDVTIKLKELFNTGDYFMVVFTGRKSSKAKGSYCKDTNELLIHNNSFSNDIELMDWATNKAYTIF